MTKTLTNAEVSQMLAQGLQAPEGAGAMTCCTAAARQPTGTRLSRKRSARPRIRSRRRPGTARDLAERQQMPSGNPTGK